MTLAHWAPLLASVYNRYRYVRVWLSAPRMDERGIMRGCPVCRATYSNREDRCRRDGAELVDMPSREPTASVIASAPKRQVAVETTSQESPAARRERPSRSKSQNSDKNARRREKVSDGKKAAKKGVPANGARGVPTPIVNTAILLETTVKTSDGETKRSLHERELAKDLVLMNY